jgi:hypothetical protein
MPVITLSDEAQRAFPFPARPLEVAQAISSGPGRSALALITELNVEGMLPPRRICQKFRNMAFGNTQTGEIVPGNRF